MKKLMLLMLLVTGVSLSLSAQGRGHKKGHHKRYDHCDDRRYDRRDDCRDKRYYRNERRDHVYYEAPRRARGRVVVVHPPLLPPPPPFPLPLPPRPRVSGTVVINAGF